ncbi:Beta-barrel assembly machine subunit BamB [Modicisalibacter ilicicola DSM 19980]|uniref:Outer membrane protein assembly factor BamB n=1 Tax=Modicisalibacter ilicicola DSM 19980 TaxID=1121942 RepID=A0A1M4TA78_9GAMM|nr:outer membrane protein assembly factor BamB [Halomonas ilicicola]SHE41254.1 Beta-barrel assembly machine subunit BamB [Halomonas ilicicola DSM 19980]
MKSYPLIASAALIALLAGCAGKVEPEYPPSELTAFDPQVVLDERWDQDVGDGLGTARYPITPTLDDGRLFVADQSGLLRAIDAENGETRWEVALDAPVSSGLTAVAGRVYLGTRNGEVLALDQEDGEEIWRSRVSSEVLAAPQANRSLLVVQSVDGAVTALDRESGEERWVYTTNQPALTLRGTGTPRVIEQVTFAGFANGRVATLDNRSGQSLWDLRVAVPQGRSEVDRLVDLDGQPLLTRDGRLYVTSYNGRLLALEATSGEILWSREMSSYLTPLLVGDTLFTVDEASHVLALDALSGRLLWESDALEGRWLTAPAFVDGHIALGDYEGYLHLLDADDGAIAGREDLGGDGISLPLLADEGRLYIMTNDGELSAFDVEPVED